MRLWTGTRRTDLVAGSGADPDALELGRPAGARRSAVLLRAGVGGAVALVLGVVGVHQWMATSPEQLVPASTATPAPHSESSMSRVPEDFRAACGRPGAVVHLRTTPSEVRIDKRDCDLTGVSVLSDAGRASLPDAGPRVGQGSVQVDIDEDGYRVRWLGFVGQVGNL